MWQKLLWIALAGAIGTVSRFALATLVQRACGDRFPYGTLAVNAVGCFLFGAIWSLAEQRMAISSETRVIVLTGFMGAFTTFSTFAFETAELLRNSAWLTAGGNLLAQNLLGVSCVLLGFAVIRALSG